MPYLELNLLAALLSQIYVDKLCFPWFGEEYTNATIPSLAEGEIIANHDIALTAGLIVLIYVVNKIVPYLGLEDKKAAAKKNLRAQANLGLKAANHTPSVHVGYHLFFSGLAFAGFCFALNMLSIMYSPISCEIKAAAQSESIDKAAIMDITCYR